MNNNHKNIQHYIFDNGSISRLSNLVDRIKSETQGTALYLIDHYFKDNQGIINIPINNDDIIHFVDTTDEPKTTSIDTMHEQFRKRIKKLSCVVGIGGGSALDTAKAISNLWTNGGYAADYQGWDLVKKPGIYKIGIPTLSGTGAESSRTCVMSNPEKGIKLGMNSDHTIFDQLVMDPLLTVTVPRDQYFYTGLDTYIHCIESLAEI